ncbi:MAG: nucleoid-associated protein [Clostridium sp.]
MRNIKDITIEKAIIHIIDSTMEEPILNSRELYLNEDTLEFIGKHIAKASSDEEAKYAVFNGENNIKEMCRRIIYESDAFIDVSKEIANIVFNQTKANGLIPSGDLIVVKFNCEYGRMLAIMKMIYNKTYIHSIDYVEDEMIIDIKPQFIGLPDTMQKLQKCALINFEDEYEALIVNRPTRQEKDAKTLNTFSDEIMKCSLVDDKRDHTKTFAVNTEKWVRENLKEDAGKAEEFRREITSVLKNNDVIDIKEVATTIIPDEELAQNFVETIKDSGINKEKIEVDREWVEKKLKRKKLKIDKDMEIYINSEAYNDINRFQIKKNGDGTIDIIIRQVRNYFEKQ